MLIGKQLRDLRTAKGLTQHNVEDRTGILCCYLSRIENGRTVPSVDTLEKLAAAYEIPLWKVFRDSRDRTKPLRLHSDRNAESPKDAQFLAKLAERKEKIAFEHALGLRIHQNTSQKSTYFLHPNNLSMNQLVNSIFTRSLSSVFLFKTSLYSSVR